MKKHNQLLHKNAGLIGAICGSLLIGIPLSPLPGETKPIAQLTPNRIVPAGAPTTPATVLNPRPSIFNEPPYNRDRASATAPSVSPAVPDQTNPPVQPAATRGAKSADRQGHADEWFGQCETEK